jgi:hypothetical protein
MYGKLVTGSAVGAGGISTLPDTGGFLPLGAGVEAAVLFVAAFTLLAASLALLRLVPWREE